MKALILILLSLTWCGAGFAYDPLNTGHPASSFDSDWSVSPNRTIPVRVFLPTETQPAPVILFSHGLGGSREGSNFLGQHLAFTEREPRRGEAPRNPNHHRVILATSTAFWDAYLKKIPAARNWLKTHAHSVMEPADRWQVKQLSNVGQLNKPFKKRIP